MIASHHEKFLMKSLGRTTGITKVMIFMAITEWKIQALIDESVADFRWLVTVKSNCCKTGFVYIFVVSNTKTIWGCRWSSTALHQRDKLFPEKIILRENRGTKFACPSHRPYLNSLDFHLWAVAQEQVPDKKLRQCWHYSAQIDTLSQFLLVGYICNSRSRLKSE